ncbi:MAG: hypothetical protein KAU06_11370 [Candidatus Marinimicrobia bacterium]|nr:hypothetical protein [Candidatus Neomarinimicrobiota bacterium]
MYGAVMLAVLSGVGFGLIGITFRMGQSRNVIPLHISMCMGIAGCVFFGIQVNWQSFFSLPLLAVLLPVISAFGNLASMHFTKVSLSRGPLSPLWCAMNLTFLIVVIYSAFAFSETILPFQFAALVAGILCVIFASNLGNQPDTEKKGPKPERSGKDKFIYAGSLLIVLLGNSTAFVIIKDLGTRLIPGSAELTYLVEYRSSIFFLMYSSMAITCLVLVLIQKAKPNKIGDLIRLGTLAAGGSIVGMFLLGLAAALPAALIFTINGMIAILIGVIASVVAFGEKRTPAWYGTVGFGILAVILANLDKLLT